ncbi:hypothetical protein ABZ863_23535 [Saccharomonospora sp. NPDC046836]|uniref:hypothetical protein n=1 Tax=Saccharomonospora sp. NPDC046836 TaxID=3156921 RepID=UPI0033E5FDDC
MPDRPLPFVPNFSVLTVADVPPQPGHLGLWNPIPGREDSGLLDYVGLVINPDTVGEVIIQSRPQRHPDDEIPQGPYGALVPSARSALLAVDDAGTESREAVADALADGSAPWEPAELVVDGYAVRGWRAIFPERRVTVAALGDVTVGVIDRPDAANRRFRTVSSPEMMLWVASS